LHPDGGSAVEVDRVGTASGTDPNGADTAPSKKLALNAVAGRKGSNLRPRDHERTQGRCSCPPRVRNRVPHKHARAFAVQCDDATRCHTGAENERPCSVLQVIDELMQERDALVQDRFLGLEIDSEVLGRVPGTLAMSPSVR